MVNRPITESALLQANGISTKRLCGDQSLKKFGLATSLLKICSRPPLSNAHHLYMWLIYVAQSEHCQHSQQNPI